MVNTHTDQASALIFVPSTLHAPENSSPVSAAVISTAACFGESKYEEIWIENNQARICFLSIGEFRKY